MSVAAVNLLEPDVGWGPAARGRVGMFCLIAAEVAIFTIFVVAYVFYLGKSITGPTPQQVLHAPFFFSICLLSSSVTIHLAVRSLKKENTRAFASWWLLTLLLGATFLAGTAAEWRHLIYDEGLTIQTNLFGTTYYSLVGLHAFHVLMGLLALCLVWFFAVFGKVTGEHVERVDTLALYWHFVDTVWVVVFLVVYVIGR
jgi:cytochrome c oxidase subunit 3/cytochrome o ubiquinol oxidase subunit 3